jgi:FkbM family methyltransferase
MFRKIVNKILPNNFKRYLRKKILGVDLDTYSFSQCGEDAIINSIFQYVKKKDKGYYIDIGAYHPTKGSNTYLLYKLGWRGINIDPNPHSINIFNRERPDDINLLMGISKEQKILDYYLIDEKSTMNSFSKDNLKRIGLLDKVKEVRKIQTFPLSYVSEKYINNQEKVDFLNIDTEGMELEILESNNWEKISPDVIAIEQNNVLTFDDVMVSEVCKYLKSKNYSPVAKNIIIHNVATVIYLKQ